MSTRALAAETLAPVLAGRASLSAVFEKNIQQVDSNDRGFFQELCYGCLRQFHSLEGIVNQLLDKPLKTKDQDVNALILIGIYQLKFLRVPDHAAISESVEAAKVLKKQWAAKLINGVLRNYQRNADKLEIELQKNETYCWSHPQWLVSRLQEAWPTHWQEILRANNAQPPLTIRINTHKTDMVTYKQLLQQNKIKFCETALSHLGLRLFSSGMITELPGYENGLFSVQDEGAQIAANLLSLAPGSRILDACSAPGGKAAHILESDPHIAELVCIELEAERMKRVQENLARLGHKATLVVEDACDVKKWWDGKLFDGILLDVPCSASGVIRRHPDIKLLRRPADLAKLAELQAHILRTVWQTLAPGGMLVYATCSVLPEENEEVVKLFIEEQDDALHDPVSAHWGIERPFGRQLFPQEEGHDGFYYARIIKRH